MPHSRWPAIGEGRYVRQAEGAAEYGHVRIRMYPSPPGSGLLLKDQTSPGAIPNNFLTAALHMLRAAAKGGIAGGFLVEDIQIDLVDGSYHDIDSSEKAFRMAAAMAFRDAVDGAGLISDTFGDDHASPVREPRRPRPVPRDSSVALPEPDDALNNTTAIAENDASE